MAIKFTATPEQVEVLGKITQSHEARDSSYKKRRFVNDFLELGERVSRPNGGSGRSIAKGLMHWETTGSSNRVYVPIRKGSPAMGANMSIYSSVVKKERGDKVVSSHTTAAEVYVGAVDEADGFGHLVAGKLVMQVFNYPPTIYFGPEGNLSNVEPETPEWDQMAEFVGILTSQEDALTNRL